jgi:hypothetical protein
MTGHRLLCMSAILSTAIAAPLSAQGMERAPSAYALNLPNVKAGIESAPTQRRELSIATRGKGEATPSIRLWKAGNETATKPWSAPVGHHQPTASDVREADSRLPLDQEDANVDRIIRGICRGC